MATILQRLKGEGGSEDAVYYAIFFWAFLAAICLGLCMYCLRESQPGTIINGELEKSIADTNFFIAAMALSIVSWFGFILLAAYCRGTAFLTTNNPPGVVIALACIISMIIPVALSEYVIDPTKVNYFSLLAAIFYCAFITSVQMMLMPSYDYQVFHISLGLCASILAYMCRSSPLGFRILWYFLGAIGGFVLLYIHHLLVTPGAGGW